MKRIILKCQKNCQDIDRESAICFHGWLMQYVSPSFANQTHRTGNNPFSLYTLMDDIEISFVLNLLTESAEKEIMPVVLDDHCKSLALSRTDQGVFKIVSKTVLQLTQEELSHRFYSEGIERFHKIQLLTPTAFKTHGHYYFLPDIRLIFQSLMKKYNSVFEGTERINLDLLKIEHYPRLKGTRTILYPVAILNFSMNRTLSPLKGDENQKRVTLIRLFFLIEHYPRLKGTRTDNTLQ